MINKKIMISFGTLLSVSSLSAEAALSSTALLAFDTAVLGGSTVIPS